MFLDSGDRIRAEIGRLIGDTSGAERDGKQMRSDCADPEPLTEVTLDFTLGEHVLRVHRVRVDYSGFLHEVIQGSSRLTR